MSVKSVKNRAQKIYSLIFCLFFLQQIDPTSARPAQALGIDTGGSGLLGGLGLGNLSLLIVPKKIRKKRIFLSGGASTASGANGTAGSGNQGVQINVGPQNSTVLGSGSASASNTAFKWDLESFSDSLIPSKNFDLSSVLKRKSPMLQPSSSDGGTFSTGSGANSGRVTINNSATSSSETNGILDFNLNNPTPAGAYTYSDGKGYTLTIGGNAGQTVSGGRAVREDDRIYINTNQLLSLSIPESQINMAGVY
ncbi:uncharacterized protein LOC129793704 isoform X1 [Lutzomyia longipalpis]|uniref:uncharacterized protein LOC129793704 isoform X1 n=1 Tax=Lutzomyia longipalpis TaxID=7200 RepID=UPI00248443CF|nr:uncharacterized protein LOC129793704 isoform X1 [Lutzomyia longipalpis]